MKWPENIEEARELQLRIRDRLNLAPLQKDPEYVAGVDAAFSGDAVIAAACLYRFPGLEFIEQAYAAGKTVFPYLPGYLAFREGPAIITAVKKLKKVPDLILVDGQGIAHPRGFGIASHLGVLLNIPAIGCAKSRLIGDYKEPGPRRGNWSALRYNGKMLGAVLRTRDNVRPLFVSPGHGITIEEAVRITLACIDRCRIPEPLRCADHLSREIKSRLSAGSIQ